MDIWNVLTAIVSLVVIGGFGLAGYTVYWLIKYTLAGRSDNRIDQLPRRMAHFVKYVFGQARVIREPAGLLHCFVFWGFIVLQFETVEYIIRGIFPHFTISDVIGITLANGVVFGQDMFGLIITIGVIILGFRRYVIRPRHSIQTFDAALILLLIAGLMVTKFIANAGHIAEATSAAELGWNRSFTPIANWTNGWLFGGAFQGHEVAGWAKPLVFVCFSLHILIVAFFANWVPRGKHMHVFTAMPNVFFRKLEPAGALYPLDLEDEEAEYFGASKLEDLSWKQMLDAYTCTECCRCEHYCPAYNTGKALNPMEIVQKIQLHMREKGAKVIKGGAEDDYPPLAGSIISEEELWACTTCGACVANCPVFIEHVDTIVDLRRYLCLTEASFPGELGPTFRNLENKSNPWGFSNSERADWTDGLDIEIPLLKDCETAPDYLFFVGCAGSFDDRQKKVTADLARLLKAADVSFAILGKEEGCTGDPARRLGNEYLYWQLATENIETFNKYNVTKVITSCPHCFHTISKEYPQLGGNYEVVHHTHLLQKLIAEGRLQLKGTGGTQRVVYHDSCYIGRWNHEYDSPRDVLSAVPGTELVEMELNRRKSMCCGAGGGRMWMEENDGQRVNIARADQALATEPDVIALACPFCMTMYMDAVAHRGADERVKMKDIAEILAENLPD